MKFEEKSWIDRCMDIVMGRDGDNVTLFFRVPAYSDLPDEIAAEHRKSVVGFLEEKFPELQEIYSYNGASEYKAVLPKEVLYERLPNFPKESEDDSVFRKEAEIALKKIFCSRSARIYSDNAGLWETANLASARVFPKFPYPLKADLSVVEDDDVVTINFPWLAYRFYAPIFEKTAKLLVKKLGARILNEPPETKLTASAWTKKLVVEGENKNYVANLVSQGLKELGFDVNFRGKETPIKKSHIEKFKKVVTTAEEKPAPKKKAEIKDQIVPYNDKPLIYIQLFPETADKVKDKVAEFVEEKGLKGGQFVSGRGYMKSYIIGDASTMAGFENRVKLAEELSQACGVPAELSEPVVGIYDMKDPAGNTRVCVRVPRAWDRSVDKKQAHESSKALDALVKEFQEQEWEPVFPGTYVKTYSLLIPKGAEDEVEKAKSEAVEIVSGFKGIKHEFVDMKERRAQKAEREIRKNIEELRMQKAEQDFLYK
jgi:hypothetical protein